MQFKLITGFHSDGVTEYKAGDIITSDKPLDKIFANKFQKISGEEEVPKKTRKTRNRKTKIADSEEVEEAEEVVEEKEIIPEYKIERISPRKFKVVNVDGEIQHEEDYLSKTEADVFLKELLSE